MKTWRRVTMRSIRRHVEDRPEGRRWRWDGWQAHSVLSLVSPQGRHWQVKLQRGFWVRPLPKKPEKTT